jgi:basic membrane protein A
VQELTSLQRAQDELWAQLRGEVDPDRRMSLLSEFGDNRAEIERLTEALGASGRAVDDGPVAYRVQLVDQDSAEPEVTGDGPLTFDDAGDLVPSPGLASSHAAHLDLDRDQREMEVETVLRANADHEDGDDHDDLGQVGVEDAPATLGRAADRPVPPPPPTRSRPPAPQSRPPAMTSQHPVITKSRTVQQRARANDSSPRPDGSRRILLLFGGLGVGLAMAWLLLARTSDDPSTSVASEVADGAADDSPAAPATDVALGELVVGLRNMGLDGVLAERRGDTIHLIGTVPTGSDRDAAAAFAATIVPDTQIDTTELLIAALTTPSAIANPGRAATYQAELDRVVASTPIIFDVDQTALSELHSRILNSVGSIINAYPEFRVTIVGFADGTGSDESNRAVSLARAESVEAYLVGLGIPAERFEIAARGEDTASGSDALANLERRVEFEIIAPASAEQAPGAAPPIRVAIIGPSARNDLAFTQSMVDAVEAIAAERGNVDIAVTDSTFVPDEAAAAVRGYADDGYDLVIAHGSQFGSLLLEIAPQYPEVAFAWGTASDTFGLPNVYAYDAAAHEGGYVLGAMSTLLSSTGVVGVIGPIEVGDAQLYVDGFNAGARLSKPDATVLVTYTGSFSDLTLSAEAAQSHVGGGADVLTGSAQMVVGAVSVAQENGALWFGTQANQASLAPSLVVASQVYHWEVILRQIVADVDAGTLGGRNYTANLANGGLVIEYNPGYPLPDDVRSRADQVIAGIVAGTVEVPVG